MSELASLLEAREGHFRFESGHHGWRWLELDRLFLRPARLRTVVGALARRVREREAAIVCGPLNGGAFVAAEVASVLDLGFVWTRRRAGTAVSYEVPDSLRGALAGQRVAVVDDVLNAGSAVRKTVADVRRCDAEVVSSGGLLALGAGPERMAAEEGLPLDVVESWPHDLWDPVECPLCSAGVPLDVAGGVLGSG